MDETAARPTPAARAPTRRWWSGLFWKCLLSMLTACWISTILLSLLGVYMLRRELRDDMAPPALETSMRRELAQLGPMPDLAAVSPAQCQALLQGLLVRVVGMDTPKWMYSHSFAGGAADGRIAIRYRDRHGRVCLYPERPSAPLARALEQAGQDVAADGVAAARTLDRDGDWVSVAALPLAGAPGASLGVGQHAADTTATFLRMSSGESGDMAWLAFYLLVISAMASVAVATLLTRRIGHAEQVADSWAAGDLDARIHDRGRDEFGGLAHRFDRMADALGEVIQVRQQLAVSEERNRLARDLHDSVSQQLFSMTLTAQAARVQLEKNPARTAAQLERLQETAAAALAEMRALIFQLRPPGLSEQGLIVALQQHVSALGRREGLTVNLEVTGEEQYARGVEQAIYRIVQEALNNVVKHAGACNVAIALDLQPDRTTLRVIDDGAGFDLAVLEPSNGRHLGLVSMRERAAEIGVGYVGTKESLEGTEVVVVVPRTSL